MRRVSALYTYLQCQSRSSSSSSKFSMLEEVSEESVGARGWVNNIPVEDSALKQIKMLCKMKNIIKHPVAIMPDVHTGIGCTVGTVIPTSGALIPASVGVDIGCGMIAVKTSLTPEQLPASLDNMRLEIEAAVPHGRTHSGRRSLDTGSWTKDIPENVQRIWKEELNAGFEELCKRDSFEKSNHITHLGTLGTGNHFIEVCLDDDAVQQHVWVMLHSGSRGIGGRIGNTYIQMAQKDMENLMHQLPHKDLAYLTEGTQHFKEYVEAVEWAQSFAMWNRRIMLSHTLQAIRKSLPESLTFTVDEVSAVNCHHNYVERCEVGEEGEVVWLTRKGATSAKKGQLAVIPGSMGARSYIVRGRGNKESYCSCSHGAGRLYSRGETKRRFTLADHERATAGVSCRKDAGVLDETPGAYKDIDTVMTAQEDIVDIVAVLKQVICVKG